MKTMFLFNAFLAAGLFGDPAEPPFISYKLCCDMLWCVVLCCYVVLLCCVVVLCSRVVVVVVLCCCVVVLCCCVVVLLCCCDNSRQCPKNHKSEA